MTPAEHIQYIIHQLAQQRDLYNKRQQIAGNSTYQGNLDALIDAISRLADIRDLLLDQKISVQEAAAKIAGYREKLDMEMIYMSARAGQIREMRDQLRALQAIQEL